MTAMAFTLFLVKAITLSLDLITPEDSDYAEEFWLSIAAVLDMIIITLFAMPLLQKPENEDSD